MGGSDLGLPGGAIIPGLAPCSAMGGVSMGSVFCVWWWISFVLLLRPLVYCSEPAKVDRLLRWVKDSGAQVLPCLIVCHLIDSG